MPALRIFPLWQVHPRWVEVELESGAPLGRAIGQALGLVSDALVAADRNGGEPALSLRVGESEGVEELAVATRSILRPQALLARAFADLGGEGETSDAPVDAVADSAGPGLPMRESERLLAAGLRELGFGLDPAGLDLSGLVDSFPELPVGWGLTQSSPYRVVLASSAVLAEAGEPDLERIEQAVELAAPKLWSRLRLSDPDALDLRLHLFLEVGPESWSHLRRWVGMPRPASSETLPGRARGAWRRLVIHPVLDSADRLQQTARLGQRLVVERLERGLRRRLQDACSAFIESYATEDGRYLDYQAHAGIRSLEERFASQAELLLLARLERLWSDRSLAASGRSQDLASGLLRGAGLLDRWAATDGERLGELAWRLAAPLFERADQRFGGAIETLAPGRDEDLRGWLRELQDARVGEGLGEGDVALIARTCVVDAACRLRQEIETLVERRLVPREGVPELSLAQFLDTIETLAEDLGDLREPEKQGSSSVDWLRSRREIVGVEVTARLESVRQAGDPLLNWSRRWLARLAGGQREVYGRLAAEVEGLRRTWLEARILDWWLSGDEDGGLLLTRLVEDLQDRMAGCVSEVRQLRDSLRQEIEQRERVANVGRTAEEPALPRAALGRLGEAVERFPLVDALRTALRSEEGLRDLFRLDAEQALLAMIEVLREPMRQAVAEVVGRAEGPDIRQQLEAAVESLFLAATLPPHGGRGQVGSLDGRTHLVVIAPPELLLQAGGERALEAQVRGALRHFSLADHLPIEIHGAKAAPGMLISRCVHALSLEDLGG